MAIVFLGRGDLCVPCTGYLKARFSSTDSRVGEVWRRSPEGKFFRSVLSTIGTRNEGGGDMYRYDIGEKKKGADQAGVAVYRIEISSTFEPMFTESSI